LQKGEEMNFELLIEGYAEDNMELPEDLVERILKTIPARLTPTRLRISGTTTKQEEEIQRGVRLLKETSYSTTQDVVVSKTKEEK